MINVSWEAIKNNIKDKLDPANFLKTNRQFSISGEFNFYLDFTNQGELPY